MKKNDVYIFTGRYDLNTHHWKGGFWGKQIYEFNNDPSNLLTATCGLVQYRPDHHFFTDLGSTPGLMQFLAPRWFAKDGFSKAFLFHDSAYIHHGVWVNVNGKWEFRKLSRKQADQMLYDMVIAEGGSKTAARLIYIGVRAGGWYSWRKSLKENK